MGGRLLVLLLFFETLLFSGRLKVLGQVEVWSLESGGFGLLALRGCSLRAGELERCECFLGRGAVSGLMCTPRCGVLLRSGVSVQTQRALVPPLPSTYLTLLQLQTRERDSWHVPHIFRRYRRCLRTFLRRMARRLRAVWRDIPGIWTPLLGASLNPKP